MNHKSSAAQADNSSLPRLVENARRHWEARRQSGHAQRDASPRTFTIAISREVGTQGTLVAQEVGKLLGWHVYDHELLEHIANEMGLRTALVESVDEKQQSWLLESVEAFLSAPAKSDWGPLVSESAYVHHLVQTVLALGIHGECVIVGRGAAFILPPETTLRVRLVGAERDRTAELSRSFGISEREAARRVRDMDRERNDFVQDHFFKDPIDPRNYDLVINTAHLSVAQRAELIVETLHRLQAHQKEKGTVGTTS